MDRRDPEPRVRPPPGPSRRAVRRRGRPAHRGLRRGEPGRRACAHRAAAGRPDARGATRAISPPPSPRPTPAPSSPWSGASSPRAWRAPRPSPGTTPAGRCCASRCRHSVECEKLIFSPTRPAPLWRHVRERGHLAAREDRHRRHRPHALGQAGRARGEGSAAPRGGGDHPGVRGRRDLPPGGRRLQLVLHEHRPAGAVHRLRGEAAALRVAGVGRRRRRDVRRVPQRGVGGGERAGELRRRAQGHDDGGRQSLRPVVRADGGEEPDHRRADGVRGALRPAVARPDVRAGGASAHAQVRHDRRPVRRGDHQRGG